MNRRNLLIGYLCAFGIATATAIAAGVVFLHEPFTSAQGVAAALIVLGVCIANWGCSRVSRRIRARS